MHCALFFPDPHPAAIASPSPVESPRALKAIATLSTLDGGELDSALEPGARAVAQPSEQRRTIDTDDRSLAPSLPTASAEPMTKRRRPSCAVCVTLFQDCFVVPHVDRDDLGSASAEVFELRHDQKREASRQSLGLADNRGFPAPEILYLAGCAIVSRVG